MGALIRYHGGKVRLADRLISLFPGHDCYIEPFGGGAAVLLAKPRVRLEVYNDLDGDMVALFRALRDQPEALAAAIVLTPFAREEHQISYLTAADDLERARRVLVRSHFGHGSSGIHRSTGFRSAGMRAGTLPVHGWMALPDTIRDAAERMRGVVIEQRPAVQVILAHDGPATLHYVDPPYLPETRDRGRDYRHEMSRNDHAVLLDCLRSLQGAVVLSGYGSALYDDALRDWRRVEVKVMADRAARRTEVIWCNFADAAPLFAQNRGTLMVDKPMLFSAPMVRALLHRRKMQTRRMIKPQPIGPMQPLVSFNRGQIEVAFGPANKRRDGGPRWWRLLEVGDRLWVREACATWTGDIRDVVYRADETDVEWANLRHDAKLGFWKIRPSIHMPR